MILYVYLHKKLTQERNRGTNRIFVPHDCIHFPSNFHTMFFTASNSLNHVKKANKQENNNSKNATKNLQIKNRMDSCWQFMGFFTERLRKRLVRWP